MQNKDLYRLFKGFRKHLKEGKVNERTFSDYKAKKGDWVDVPTSDIAQGDPSERSLSNEFYDLIDFSYSNIGGHFNIKGPQDIPGKYSGWVAVDTDGDPDPDAVRMSKKSVAGNKLTGGATDGTPAGKAAFLKKTVELLNTQGNYGEMSDAIAHVMIKRFNVPSVNDEMLVRKALGKEIKWIGANPEGKYPGYDGWYIRSISGKAKLKIMLGKPNL